MSKFKEYLNEAKPDTEYEKFFKGALKKFNISSPGELKTDQEKKEFFDYVDDNYEALDEASVDGKAFLKDLTKRVSLLKAEVKDDTNDVYGAIESLVNLCNSYKDTLK